jgi:hypothetical protein
LPKPKAVPEPRLPSRFLEEVGQAHVDRLVAREPEVEAPLLALQVDVDRPGGVEEVAGQAVQEGEVHAGRAHGALLLDGRLELLLERGRDAERAPAHVLEGGAGLVAEEVRDLHEGAFQLEDALAGPGPVEGVALEDVPGQEVVAERRLLAGEAELGQHRRLRKRAVLAELRRRGVRIPSGHADLDVPDGRRRLGHQLGVGDGSRLLRCGLRLRDGGRRGFGLGLVRRALGQDGRRQGKDDDRGSHGYLPRYGPEGALPPWMFWWQLRQELPTARLLNEAATTVLRPS